MMTRDEAKVVEWINNELCDDQNLGQTYGRINRVELVNRILSRIEEPELAMIAELEDTKIVTAIRLVNTAVNNWELDEGWDKNPDMTVADW